MNLRMKMISLTLAIELLGLLILPIPVSAQKDIQYSITITDAVNTDEFITYCNNAGTRFKTKYQQWGIIVYANLDLANSGFDGWRTRTSVGEKPGEPHDLDDVEWRFHTIHMERKSMECVFVLRFEGDSGYDVYTLRLVLHDSGKGPGTYEDLYADIYITHGALFERTPPPGPRNTWYQEKHHFQAPITVEIVPYTPP